MSLKYGRLAPHPEETHPRVKYEDFLTRATLPIPFPIDWYSLVVTWGMLLNDRLGDCTAAGILHLLLSMTTYAGDPVTPADADAESLYERFGYVPGNEATDRGANEQDVLTNIEADPVLGYEVAAFAELDITNNVTMKHALATFGPLYLGINCPNTMQQQFAAGEVIDYVPGATIEGGHCIIVVGWDSQYLYVVTWGKVVKMTWAFWQAYGEEAWVVITKAWLNKNGTSPSGLDLTGLMAAFKALPAPSSNDESHEGLVSDFIETVLNFLKRIF